jgi:uroporphyrinogen-III decarboxylase
VGAERVICGNLDPVWSIQDQRLDTTLAAVAECRREAGPRRIVGAGCEIPRGTPLENVRAIVDFARATSGS